VVSSEQERFTKRSYTREHAAVFARRYDEGQRRIKVQKIKEGLQSPNCVGKRVLDLGCGCGFFSNLCRDLSARVVAMDHADSMTTITHERYGLRFPIVRAHAHALPFDDHVFDLVLLLDVIEHIYEPERVLSEIKRVLNESGKIIVTTDEPGISIGMLPKSMLRYAFEAMPKPIQLRINKWMHFDHSRYQTPQCTHVREYSMPELISLMHSQGFQVHYYDTYPNKTYLGIWGKMVEILFVGALKRFKWESALYIFTN
jgi:ubiquinone/menaquinone biosynthesis C-methylase UbiE